MATDRTDQTIKLKDGRLLGYAEYGNPDGKPVFYFHGFPSSRIDWVLFDTDGIAARLNARIIAADRPGYGLSDFKRSRKILDWPDDVIELADTLQLGRFSVLGISGGGPYALACAHRIPDRLSTAAIVCGMGPSEAPGAKDGTAMLLPGKSTLTRKLLLILMAMGFHRNPDRFLSKMKDTVADPDKLLMDQTKFVQAFTNSMLEAFKMGTRGASWDAVLYKRPWGYQLHDISMQLHLWHGELDTQVPVSVGQYVANTVPDCRAKFLPNEAHLSLAHNYIEEILNILVA
ncbi:MAG TPA: alpha/beta hydrolase [Dehalococcoidia bacterium]|nr:alpha/beta hydrolase [Dehalococcoidia bacterium]